AEFCPPDCSGGTVIPLGRALLRGSSDLPGGCDAPSRHVPEAEAPGSLPIWSCSVWGLPCPLHCCNGGALLPHLFTLTSMLPSGRYVFCGTFRRMARPSKLGRGTLPDVIRHTALRSSDFPPVFRRATVRSSCQQFIVTVVSRQIRASDLGAQTSDFGLRTSDPGFRATYLTLLVRPTTNGQRPTTGAYLSSVSSYPASEFSRKH